MKFSFVELLNFNDEYFVDDRELVTSIYGCRESSTHGPCHQGAPQCYQRADMCVLEMNIVDEARGYQVEEGCRDGSHLAHSCGK